MDRRAVLSTLGLLAAGCAAGPDRISFDRGSFAIAFTKLTTIGLTLLEGAIARNTKGGAPNDYAKRLTAFKDDILKVQADVERQIAEAPGRAQAVSADGLATVVDVLGKALPLVMPLLAAAA